MDGIKDIQDLLSQPMIRTIADAAMQFLQGIANPQPSGISPVQTPFENPGMNNFTTNLGPSQQPPENSPIPMQNPGMNPITNNLGPSQQPPNIYTLKLRNTQTFPYAYNCNCSFLTGNSPIPIQNPGMNHYTNSK